MTPNSIDRESARTRMPEALRREVRMLGDRLGRILTEYGGPELLEGVENLRRSVIGAQGGDATADEVEAESMVAGWSIEHAEEVARAFTCYFQLVNLAEERHRARVLREHDNATGSRSESLATTVADIRERHGPERLRGMLASLRVQPVLTAHPTEARRRAVVAAIARVGVQLERLEDPRAGAWERRAAERRLLEEIDTLWRTAQLRSTQIHPLDEVRTVMSVFDDTIFRGVPEIYRHLDAALQPDGVDAAPPRAPAFLRFGSWVGGDRDGNPSVTADVTEAAMDIQAEHVLRGYETATMRIGRALTAAVGTTPASAAVRSRLEEAERTDSSRMAEIEARAPGEPHRQMLLHIADRIRAVRLNEDGRYANPEGLAADLAAVQNSLAAAGAPRQAHGELQHLIWQLETFGFHFAELEVRQHSQVHERALAERSAEAEEVRATFAAIARIQRRYGVAACSRYVVSLTRSSADIANVYQLAVDAGPQLEVVPLFETVADLERAPAVLNEMIELEPVKRRLQRVRRLEVMLGYSDSTKEVGPVSANLALYRAQARLVHWSRQHGIALTIFHGRGGAIGRGGGPALRAVRAQAPGSIAGHFKVTEQGEVIFARYSNPVIARRHLEQVASAVLTSSLPEVEAVATQAATAFDELSWTIDGPSRAAYRALVESESFEDWFTQVSPLEELGRLRLGSRPPRRSGSVRLEDLRAIPWVFAWSQMRLNLPGWYGLGSGLAAAEISDLRRAYADWPLFSSIVDNSEMSLAKTDRGIALRYLDLGGRPDLTARILAEYDLTVDRILAVTSHTRLLENRRVLPWAIELRNPYIHALSLIQLHVLATLRRGDPAVAARGQLEQVLLLTVNGVSAGLQNTG
jgi:phosphoenolpyruvate carboxylase